MEPELPSLIHYYRTIPLHFIFVFLKAILPLSENEWDYDLTPTHIPIPFLITFLFNKNWYVFPRQTSLSPFPMIRIRPRLLRWCCQLFFSFESERLPFRNCPNCKAWMPGGLPFFFLFALNLGKTGVLKWKVSLLKPDRSRSKRKDLTRRVWGVLGGKWCPC